MAGHSCLWSLKCHLQIELAVSTLGGVVDCEHALGYLQTISCYQYSIKPVSSELLLVLAK